MKTIVLTALASLATFAVVLAIGTALDFAYAYLYATKPQGVGFVLGIIAGLVAGFLVGRYTYDELY